MWHRTRAGRPWKIVSHLVDSRSRACTAARRNIAMEFSRRQVIGGAAAAVGAALAGGMPVAVDAQRGAAPRSRPADEPFGYCLNTSTVRGNMLDIVAEIAAASKAGFHAIEPWITEIDAYTTKGG